MMRMEVAKRRKRMWMIIEKIVCLPMAFCLFYDRLIDWPSNLSVSPSTRTSDEKLMISTHLHQVQVYQPVSTATCISGWDQADIRGVAQNPLRATPSNSPIPLTQPVRSLTPFPRLSLMSRYLRNIRAIRNQTPQLALPFPGIHSCYWDLRIRIYLLHQLPIILFLH